ncbi:hypothetical protein Godav_002204 [Gossypium davidsonii]|uniref:Uncharacterized protein n=1 Tax=Gossypium davidsonii TaxID=34287 RepID=A0A7J8SX19_GOSDV|nr:hypothetical protein [Gossypium davidsonii]
MHSPIPLAHNQTDVWLDVMPLRPESVPFLIHPGPVIVDLFLCRFFVAIFVTPASSEADFRVALISKFCGNIMVLNSLFSALC